MRSRDRGFNFMFKALGSLAFVAAVTGCVSSVDGTAGSAPSTPGAGSASTPAAGAGNDNGTGGAGTGTAGSGTAGASPTSGAGPTDPSASDKVGASYARLTKTEYVATIQAAFGVTPALTGIPDDDRIGAYTSDVAVSEDHIDSYLLASEDLAAQIVPGKIAACTAASASTCIPQNYQPAFEKLYRRSLTADELTGLSTLLTNLEKAGLTSQDATREMVSYVLISPDFLFRATPLSGTNARAEQLAEQLSYALWDAPPDAQLMTAAKGTGSDLGARLRTEAVRLGKDQRAVVPIARFLAQWLRVDVDVNLNDPAYASAPLYLELLAYAQDALTNNTPVASLVNGSHGFVQKGDFAAYAMTAPSSTANVVPVTWPTGSARRGIIGEELFMDATRHPDATRRPIFRGHMVQSSLLCTDIPPPSAELQQMADQVPDRTKNPLCAGCHLLMEPVGSLFDSLDLDHTGPTPPAVLNGNAEVAGTYPDLQTLLDKIAKSQAFADCFSRNLLGFFLEQDPANVDKSAVSDIASIVKSGGGFNDAVSQLVVTLEAQTKAATPWCAGQ